MVGEGGGAGGERGEAKNAPHLILALSSPFLQFTPATKLHKQSVVWFVSEVTFQQLGHTLKTLKPLAGLSFTSRIVRQVSCEDSS